ncbi:predicted protein [Uncinocarpus reesii 1704]|uniref:Uncharacterized protein n=1 Tax=Uncinocarpus reesii (strain UAMH 1704) TaxID=336963 RepID=C4JKQ0_UNCRE|nr:uncharacterized protein UREG_00648 [Uncinocarpus reesii 1704]EEP75801.1 predicted protein [Uncinocarpus reesii 1704]
MLRDYSGRIVLCSATFVVPSRQPIPSVHTHYAEWLADPSIFIVRSISSALSAAPPTVSRTPLFDHRPEVRCHRPNTDVLFGIEYLNDEAEDFHQDESQYDLGIFAVRHVDKEIPADFYSKTLEDPELTKLLKPENFDWSSYDSDGDDESQFTDSGYSSRCEPSDSDERAHEPPEITPQGAANTKDDPSRQMNSRKPSSSITADLGLPYSSPTKMLSCVDTLRPQPFVLQFDETQTIGKENPQLTVGGPSRDPNDIDVSNSHCFVDQQEPGVWDFAAREERARQEWWIANHSNVHHFNWLGNPILEPSYTPPEVSLFVILSPPKPWLHSMSRIGVILWQAMKFVDPVLYDGNWGDLRRYRGLALLQSITGHTFKFYTKEGAWVYDDYSWDDNVPCSDPMDLDIYQSKPWLPVNGWLESEVCPTRQEYMLRASRYMDGQMRTKRRRPRPYQQSPLRICASIKGSSLLRTCSLKEPAIEDSQLEVWGFVPNPLFYRRWLGLEMGFSKISRYKNRDNIGSGNTVDNTYNWF